MSTELITNWAEHDNALRKLLLRLSQSLRIFDEDLTRLNLDRREIAESFQHFLAASERNTLRIVVRNPEPFRRSSPRLMELLRNYPEKMAVFECPPHLLSLGDNLLLVDDKHALVRFHKDNVRAKAIFDSSDECISYVQRFEEIAKDGGEQICATTLGL